MKYIENSEEIAFKDRNSALEVASRLLDAGYVVMLSREKQLTIIDYNWVSPIADRNDFVFMSRETYCEPKENDV